MQSTEQTDYDRVVAGSPPGLFIRPFNVSNNPIAKVGVELLLTSSIPDDILYKLNNLINTLHPYTDGKVSFEQVKKLKHYMDEMGWQFSLDIKYDEMSCSSVIVSTTPDEYGLLSPIVDHSNVKDYLNLRYEKTTSDYNKIVAKECLKEGYKRNLESVITKQEMEDLVSDGFETNKEVRQHNDHSKSRLRECVNRRNEEKKKEKLSKLIEGTIMTGKELEELNI